MTDRPIAPSARPSGPLPTDLVQGLPRSTPFIGPEALERARGRRFRARLGANESVFGPSPAAVSAMAEAATDAWMYGDPEGLVLREALAERHGVSVDRIVLGEGIDGLLGLAARLFVSPATTVVASLGSYPTFAYHVAGYGGRMIRVPYLRDRNDLTGIAEAARLERARLVYLANPDNPMGSWRSAEAIVGLLDALPLGCLLLLDEAYADTAPPVALPPVVLERRNLLRLRTFSKAMGLAGLRVGYAIGPAGLIAEFDKVRNHFGVGRVAQAAALAALGDEAWTAAVTREIARSRERIAEIAAAHGLAALPSGANFVAIDCGRDGVFARRVLEGLAAEDVFVRMPSAAPLDRCIRVSCGRDRDLDRFAAALPKALSSAAASAAEDERGALQREEAPAEDSLSGGAGAGADAPVAPEPSVVGSAARRL